MTTDDVRTEQCPMCGGSGVVELDDFYMVGPAAREEVCDACSGHGAVSPAWKGELVRRLRRASR